MALARKNFDWETMFSLSLGKDVAKKKYEERPYPDKGCSMCGPFCAIKIAEEFS